MPKQSLPKFEDSLKRLEEIIEQMDSDQLPLEELITKYEEGNNLRKHCEDLLKSARKRLETVKESSTPSPAAITDNDDEIRLF